MKSEVAAMQTASRQALPPSIEDISSPGERYAFLGFLSLFAVLLAIVTWKHELYIDEAQAWLIARDSRNLLDLIHHLHYEGHPALWYLLLFLPAHLSFSIQWMQCINYLLAVSIAVLILSQRNLPMVIRVLLVFDGSLFFFGGIIARSYMLAGVLLIAAARCLLAKRPKHWFAITLLALAINAHFFAIPVAVGIFVWLYWLAPDPNWTLALERLRGEKILDFGRYSWDWLGCLLFHCAPRTGCLCTPISDRCCN